MKITSLKLGNESVAIGNAKRKTRVRTDETNVKKYEFTTEEKNFAKTNINPIKLGEFTKESKESRGVLIALTKLNAIGKENAVSFEDICIVFEAVADLSGLILNDANKDTRLARILNLQVSDSNNDKESWANKTSKSFRPQPNYFNLNNVYVNVTVKSVVGFDTLKGRKTDSYYLTKITEYDKLKVRGYIKPTKKAKS